MGLIRSILSVVLLILSVVGCNEVVESDTATLTVTFSLEGEGLAGVQGREGATDNCGLSDTIGAVTLEVPVREEFFCTADKEGHAPRLFPMIIGPNGGSRLRTSFGTDARAAEKHNQVNSPYPTRKGIEAPTSRRRPLKERAASRR